ncbi:MAG: pyruvate, phosphate dikinase [Planctomycetes bacterium]|nr:pyruvate, phosphate dikinase [Planctomycetota bacterium]
MPATKRAPSRSKPAPARPQSAKKSTAQKKRFVFSFGDGRAEGGGAMKELLGGKGAGLAEMSRLGLPVPPGFTISTEVCTHFYANGRRYPTDLRRQVDAALQKIEKETGKRFGDAENPLLLSVRSGARVSMPGMMDTVLNLGLNETTVEGLAKASGNPRFAWDAYRRFVHMYADVVLGLKAARGESFDPFAQALEDAKRARGVTADTDLDADALKDLVHRYKALVRERCAREFPESPDDQLWGAISAVFESWNTERAVVYRQLNHIPGHWGTAVNVMAMVFGNLGETSATGVCFTRDPSTGAKEFYGEFLMNAQGEDVVAGIRTPFPIPELGHQLPKAYKELQRVQKLLEKHYRDMQDLEFTIERGKLHMLQCRSGKRTGFAAVKIATDMVREKLITREEALRRVQPEALNQLLQPIFNFAEQKAARESGKVLTKGLNAGPGAASGHIVFDAETAEHWVATKKESVILVRIETSPEDIRGMSAASGILTARGGMTSHAALVARQMGKVCVAGAGALEIDYVAKTMKVGSTTLKEGDWLSLDGSSGEVIAGKLATQPSEVMAALFHDDVKAKKGETYRAFRELLEWADSARTLGVRANADQPDQAHVARAFGAAGIGLCRTEHMFFEGTKIDAMREMILAESKEERERALAKLLPLQRADFEGIFEEMAGFPVTIRSLDPPLHEFLPHEDEQIQALAKDMNVPAARLHAKVEQLKELNPMLGHRGCRLGITYPEITAMQARAIFEAACNVALRTKKKPIPEIMIPLVATEKELALQAQIVRDTAAAVFAEKKITIPYLVGTMIELPRAALIAEDIARTAEFFSFGTNDLTQTTYGISRDDGSKFIPQYIEHEIFARDPFAGLDRQGVGRLMRIACTEGKKSRPGIKLGICGEHGGDPYSIEFCNELGLNYVSCSPLRVPIARLAAAQAALAAKK